WIAVSFVALGVAAAAFVRLRQRRLKAGALLASGLSVVVLVGLLCGGMGIGGWVLLLLVSAICLLGPAFLEGSRIGRRASRKDWDISLVER
ncbi:MAG: hypothetical protein AB1603_06405, partial [Chloroflexota bacterium]